MRKFLGIILILVVLGIAGYFAVMYSATFSDGKRSGEFIKLSRKGMIFKTWEGELSQGIAGAQIFKFTVLDSETEVIKKMQELEGQYVKVHYVERYKTFPWWGDTKYFIDSIDKDTPPYRIK
jgi:hypothetical protein